MSTEAALKSQERASSTDENLDLRHGLGLQIASRVIRAHQGNLSFTAPFEGGSWEARFRSLIRLLILALCALIRAARPDTSDGTEGSLAMRSAFPMMRVSGVRMSWDMPAIQFARASFCLAMRSDARVTLSERFASVPEGVPLHYTLQDVARFSKGYISDYPVFTRVTDAGLLVLGYPMAAGEASPASWATAPEKKMPNAAALNASKATIRAAIPSPGALAARLCSTQEVIPRG